MLNLLVVEDDESDYHFIEMALKETPRPTRVSWVSSGAAGIEYLAGDERYRDRTQWPVPDVVVVDLNMPGLGGFDVLQWMRAHPLHRGTPVLVISSSESPGDIEKAYRLGANSYFVKPQRFEDFVSLFQHIAAYWSYARTAAHAFTQV
jgi:CheY-like chemotaxis protein